MQLFKWIKGRQEGTEYHKWCFMFFRIGRLGFDGYILRYQPKTVLPMHKDAIDGKMLRLNIKLRGKCLFHCMHEIIEWGEFLHLFRPDKEEHGLIVYTKTYKLSLGFVKFHKT